MKLKPAQVYILNVLTDGLENINTIKSTVALDISKHGQNIVVTDSLIAVLLKELEDQKFIVGFRWQPEKNQYLPAVFQDIGSLDKLVYYELTSIGRNALEENWTEEFQKIWNSKD